MEVVHWSALHGHVAGGMIPGLRFRLKGASGVDDEKWATGRSIEEVA
jgi:hypothetical protein